MNPTSRADSPSRRIGPYTILRLLGRGGSGTVFEARRDTTGTVVALKVLAPDLARDPELVARVRREGRALAQLSHPAIVRVVDQGEADGSPYLALELLPGGSLADLVKARGQLAWREALRFGAVLAQALAHVHEAGLVHRDVKPANVFLDAEGNPRLGDFGLVRSTADSIKGLTRSGESLGTPEFLAPEQIDRAREVDFRADLYALGALLHVLLTGATPFAGVTGAQLLYAKLSKVPPSARALVPDVPQPVADLVARLLEREPASRGPDAGAVARELEALLAGNGPKARGRSVAGPAALGLVALAGLGAVALEYRRHAGASPPTASPSPAPTSVRASPPSPSPRSPRPTPSPSPRVYSERDLALAEKRVEEANEIIAITHGSNEADVHRKLDGVAPTASVHEVLGRLYLKRIGYVEPDDAKQRLAYRELAVREFTAATDDVKTYAVAWLGLARARQAAVTRLSPEDFEAALAAVSRAVESDPAFGPAWWEKADILYRSGHDAESLDVAREGLQRDPGNGGLWAWLASALSRRQDYAAALQAALAADSIEQGTNAAALETIARCSLALGRPAEALPAARQAARFRIDSGSPLLYLGLAQLRTGARDAALESLHLAEKNTPLQFEELVLEIAEAYGEADDAAGAVGMLPKLRSFEAAATDAALKKRLTDARAGLEKLVR